MRSAVRLRTVTGGPELEQVRQLLHEYNAHLATTIDPSLLQHRAAELAALPANFLPPAGALLLATREGVPLGCAGLRPAPISENTGLGAASIAEFCRLWVTALARGQQVGEQLLRRAIHLARDAGYGTLVLNSVPGTMQAAQTLYLRAGFSPIAPYKHVAIPDIAFFGLDLTGQVLPLAASPDRA